MKNRDRFVGLRPTGRKGLSVPSADGERAASRASHQCEQGGVHQPQKPAVAKEIARAMRKGH